MELGFHWRIRRSDGLASGSLLADSERQMTLEGIQQSQAIVSWGVDPRTDGIGVHAV